MAFNKIFPHHQHHDYEPVPKTETSGDGTTPTAHGSRRRYSVQQFLKRNLTAITISGLLLVIVLLVLAVIAAITIEPFRQILVVKLSSTTSTSSGQRQCFSTNRHTTLSCGNSTAEATALGCSYDPLSACWLHKDCPHDYAEDFATFNDGKPFQYYYDHEMQHPMKDYTEVGNNEQGYYFTVTREHLVHCLFLLRRGHDVYKRGDRVDTMLADTGHVAHCANFLADYLRRPDPYLDSLGTQGQTNCFMSCS
ncbi:uncharacterized protein BO97DRAFT_440543 [Aspergillus homomorphus CBS 101889]|uniref:Uncharacterized protein n=1 Tax=Aspergillus homomorphus (strain CBS 101889) TaxID=1450537 RepID=A0A395I7N0_ASPHC|nr:hypothetical protein BO97DRAFT_440543 [Aspergillus homomorphus CBS 101889]RAL15946.1 hypothetical protein BO97DRAFT_440543 [Aspergillus homomorphus CBS 101889]